MFDNIVYMNYYRNARCVVDLEEIKIVYHLEWYSGIQWHTVYTSTDNRASYKGPDCVSCGAAFLPAN